MLKNVSALCLALTCAVVVSRGSAETVEFQIVTADSSIQLTDIAFLSPEVVIPLPAQLGTGDVVNYRGTIKGDLVGDNLTFSGGSAITALEHPQVKDFLAAEGGPGGPNDPAAQDINYAYFLPGYPISETDTTTLYVQLFNMVLDLPFGSVTHGQPAQHFDVQLDQGGYALVLDNPDIVNDTEWFNKPFNVVVGDDPVVTNAAQEVASITTVGNIQTLRLPINADFVFEIDACCGNKPPTEFVLTGTLVATRTLGGVPEDLNADGSVDAADAGIMFGNWAGTGQGDLNADGIVDAADAGQMFAAWTGDSTVAVPEPHSLWLMAAGMASWSLSRRKR